MVRLLSVLVMFVACYAPAPPAGAPCADGVCPAPLVCSQASLTCEVANVPPSDALTDSSGSADAADDAALDAVVDAPVDGPASMPDAQACFGSGLSPICLTTLPSSAVSLTGDLLTDTDLRCLPYTGADADKFCVVGGLSITVGSTRVVGARPLVLLATSGSISVISTLEVASHRVGNVRGGGGNASQCLTGGAAGAGQGGPGGSFGGRGGSGGRGEQPGIRPASAVATATPTTLRGGCRGGNGSNGAAGGNGGGAVYLIATNSISVQGSINASGAAGGGAGTNEAGGGGGGSGGMIVLEAPSITVTGLIFANGAGGGAGNDEFSEAQEPSSPLVAAQGGTDMADTGSGGAGSAGITLAGGEGGDGNDGGGGGGGGAGYILLVPVQAVSGTASPPPQ